MCGFSGKVKNILVAAMKAVEAEDAGLDSDLAMDAAIATQSGQGADKLADTANAQELPADMELSTGAGTAM
jgi:phage-related minor tail protein